MKKSYFLSIIFISGCKNENSPFKPILLRKVNQFIHELDNYEYRNNVDRKPLCVVLFYSKGDSCFVSLISSSYYWSKNFKGFTKLNNKIIVVYYSENSCIKSFINEKKFDKKDLVEYMYKKDGSITDPVIYNYKIVKDSLKLVKKVFP